MAKNKLVEEIEVVEEVVVVDEVVEVDEVVTKELFEVTLDLQETEEVAVDEVVEVDEVALNTPAPEVEYPGHNTRAFRQ